ncbi:MAG TPA: YjgN family protein [Candidatus Deferrimicrobiaceae bacterium]|nr:YjgN family protein [Candidatus Deferrimicrobiaceae bacterium]
MPVPPFGPVSGSAPLRRPGFHGTGGTLFGIHIVNTLLTLVTLGIYYFWAKTRLRQYLFSQTEIEGDRFAYHGTGRELLLGTLKAVLVFGVPIFLLNVVRDVLDVPVLVKVGAGLLSASLLFVLFPVAMVGARRYRLSRTSWRGIRFSFRGRAWEMMKIFILGTFFTGFTLGLYYPFFLVARQTFMVSHSYFGNERFDFDGQGRDLFWPFVLSILLTLPTLGLCWAWYIARKRRYFWDHTAFGAARFSCTVTGAALLGLWVVNVLLLVCTLGLGWPWVRVRNINFAFRNLALVGPLDLARIQQEAQTVSAIGEGLSGFFDSGFDLA